MTRGIAKRQGAPAYISAPPRLRQSHVAKPFTPQPMHDERGLLARLFGLRRG